MKYDDEYYDEGPDKWDDDKGGAAGRTLKGYKVVVAILAVVLVAVSGLYFWQSWEQKREFAIERDTLTNRMLAIRGQMDGLQTTNDSLNTSIVLERLRTDSVLDVMARERNVTRAKIRSYEKELGTMRAIMTNYINTIDSLGKLNRRLQDENLGMRRQVTTERLRADKAEERVEDMDLRIRQGARVIARDIRMTALNNNDKEVTRVARAARLRVDFVLSANALANPGSRPVYIRVTGPDGYTLAGAQAAAFDFEGEHIVYSAMRDVDYQGDDLPVGIYYSGTDLVAGSYHVAVYMDGLRIGQTEVLLR